MSTDELEMVDSEGNTALVLAAANGHAEIVKYLLNEGVNVNHVANDGYSALCHGCFLKDHLNEVFFK